MSIKNKERVGKETCSKDRENIAGMTGEGNMACVNNGRLVGKGGVNNGRHVGRGGYG
jgi:hypothetical protein